MASRKTTAPRAPKISETAEHRTIAAYFRKVGLGGCAVAMHLRAERYGDGQKLLAWKMGVQAGVPDWCILDAGRALFYELKPRGFKASNARTGNYTPHELRQLDMHNRLKRAGCVVEIVETLDEMLASLAWHGVPLRTEPPVISDVRRSVLALTETGL